MAHEIERKFLVVGNAWRQLADGVLYRQGYLNTDKHRTVRVRTVGEHGFLTVKGLTHGITRLEFEYTIPFADAANMLNELVEQPIIEKYRYRITHNAFIWEVDEFLGVNAGLILAEVELPQATTELVKPAWVGAEVSDDARYFNNNLVLHPYTTWQTQPTMP